MTAPALAVRPAPGREEAAAIAAAVALLLEEEAAAAAAGDTTPAAYRSPWLRAGIWEGTRPPAPAGADLTRPLWQVV